MIAGLPKDQRFVNPGFAPQWDVCNTMSKTTRATQALDKLGVAFTLHTYDYDPDADAIGLQAAAALGVEPRAC